jgi:thiol-disulfide isomerase/thioredoxin
MMFHYFSAATSTMKTPSLIIIVVVAAIIARGEVACSFIIASSPRQMELIVLGGSSSNTSFTTSFTSVDTATNGEAQSNDKKQRKGVWRPPSQQQSSISGPKIFSIQQPQDLLDFVIDDERLSVIKVHASWCKTCQIFDLRYRKLAMQYGDTTATTTPTSEDGVLRGKVRFAEMQYDNPANTEMCELLNATKLPYMMLYKGTKGKVDEFQCNPANFQRLIDAVNGYLVDDDPPPSTNVVEDDVTLMAADSLSEEDVVTIEVSGATTLNATIISEDSTSPQLQGATSLNATILLKDSDSQQLQVEPPSLGIGVETINDLKLQLEKEVIEKLESFEVMKAQIQYDTECIETLKTSVENLHSSLSNKDDEVSNLLSVLKSKEEERQSLSTQLSQLRSKLLVENDDLSSLQSALKSKEEEVYALSLRLSQQQKETQRADQKRIAYQTQVSQLTNKLTKLQDTISTLELESVHKEKEIREKERILQQMNEMEELKTSYEQERNSLRKLALLGIKRAQNLLFRSRSKKN